MISTDLGKLFNTQLLNSNIILLDLKGVFS